MSNNVRPSFLAPSYDFTTQEERQEEEEEDIEDTEKGWSTYS
jgi:hypothetical protein